MKRLIRLLLCSGQCEVEGLQGVADGLLPPHGLAVCPCRSEAGLPQAVARLRQAALAVVTLAGCRRETAGVAQGPVGCQQPRAPFRLIPCRRPCGGQQPAEQVEPIAQLIENRHGFAAQRQRSHAHPHRARQTSLKMMSAIAAPRRSPVERRIRAPLGQFVGRRVLPSIAVDARQDDQHIAYIPSSVQFSEDSQPFLSPPPRGTQVAFIPGQDAEILRGMAEAPGVTQRPVDGQLLPVHRVGCGVAAAVARRRGEVVDGCGAARSIS